MQWKVLTSTLNCIQIPHFNFNSCYLFVYSTWSQQYRVHVFVDLRMLNDMVWWRLFRCPARQNINVPLDAAAKRRHPTVQFFHTIIFSCNHIHWLPVYLVHMNRVSSPSSSTSWEGSNSCWLHTFVWVSSKRNWRELCIMWTF